MMHNAVWRRARINEHARNRAIMSVVFFPSEKYIHKAIGDKRGGAAREKNDRVKEMCTVHVESKYLK